MGFKEFLNTFVSYNKRIYVKLILISILLFYFTFLIYFNYFRVILGYGLEASWGFGLTFALRMTLFLVILIDILQVLFLLEIQKNVLVGFIVAGLIAFISYLILPLRIVYFGDIYMVIGCIVGISFTLKNIKLNQSFFIYGIIVGLGGTILTGILLTIFDWVVFSGFLEVSPLMFIIKFEFYFIEAIIIGLTTGTIIGGYYYYKSYKSNKSFSKDDGISINLKSNI